MISEEIEGKVLLRTLENALRFDGKADPKAVLGKILSDYPELRSRVKEVLELIQVTVNRINNMDLEEQRQQFLNLSGENLDKKRQREEKKLPPLPNVEKYDRVVMRLAPYPSGPLHIGNIRMVILNDEYAKRYKGSLYLIYDDTIGSEGKVILPEAYDYIKDGLEWLDVKVDRTIYKSDRLSIFYDWCGKLLSGGKAYVCTCEPDLWRQSYKIKRMECPCRAKTPSQNLEEWDKMLEGYYREGQAAVRLKTGMELADPALRDHVIMRISDKAHPRVGGKYSVWPLLEFSWAIDDYLLGISHILRGKDLIKEDKVEEIIWDLISAPKREFIHYGRIRFQGLSLSKSKSAKYVREGKYFGWRDPRTWSLQSLQARGFKPEAIREAILDLGLSLADIEYSPEILYSFNRKIIDPSANRLFYVDDPVKLQIKNIHEDYLKAEPPNHPDFPDRGRRQINLRVVDNTLTVLISSSDAASLTAGEKIRLKDLVNVEFEGKLKDYESRYLSGTIEDARKIDVKKIIQWVPVESNVVVEVIMPDGKMSRGIAEAATGELKINQVVQFERYGFVRIDSVDSENKNIRIKAFYLHR